MLTCHHEIFLPMVTGRFLYRHPNQNRGRIRLAPGAGIATSCFYHHPFEGQAATPVSLNQHPGHNIALSLAPIQLREGCHLSSGASKNEMVIAGVVPLDFFQHQYASLCQKVTIRAQRYFFFFNP